jgi:hypothetical protein
MALTGLARGSTRLRTPTVYENPHLWLEIRPAEVVSRTEDDPRRRALLEQDPILSARKPFRPDPRPFVDPLFPGAPRTFRFVPEVLPELARAYGIHFIADSYWGAARAASVPSTDGSTPLFEVLDRLVDTGHSWDRRGNLLRLRDRKWFVDRPNEIPVRYYRRWGEMAERLGTLTLEEYAFAAATLTDRQIIWLGRLSQQSLFPPLLADGLEHLNFVRHTLRIYAGLSHSQRQSLVSGRPLAMAQLSPAQQWIVLRQLNRMIRLGSPFQGLEPWRSGHITFSGTAEVRILEQRGRSATLRLESTSEPPPARPPDALRRFPVTRWVVKIDDGTQERGATVLTVAAEATPP